MKAPWSMVPMLLPLTAIVAGIVVCKAGVGAECAVASAIIAATCAIRRMRRGTAVASLVTVSIISAMVSGEGKPPPGIEGRTALYGGVIERIREHDANQTVTMTIDSVDGRRVKAFTASLTVPTFFFMPRENDRVTVRCALSTPVSETDLPYEIDPATLRAVRVAGFVPSDSFKTWHSATGVMRVLRRGRADVSAAIMQSGMSDETSSFVNAILTGDTSALGDDTRRMFASAGLAHILALSGLHLALIAWMAGVLLYPFFPSDTSPWRRLLTIAIVWIFAVATGLPASVTRAGVMLTVIIGAGLLHRRHSPFNSLFMASSVILLADPEALFSAGFQLTVAAVAAILAVLPALDHLPNGAEMLKRPLTMVCVPVAAMAGTALVSLYHFHTFPVHFLGANVVTSWIVAPLMVSGAAAAATGWPLMAHAADALYGFMAGVAEFFASLPGCDRMFYPTAAGTVLGMMAMTIAAYGLWQRRIAAIVPALVAVAAWITVEVYDSQGDDGERLYFARSRQSFDMVMMHGDSLIVSTTAHEHEHQSVMDRALLRYGEFMGRRGVDRVHVTRDFNTPSAWRSGDTLEISGRRFCLLQSDEPLREGWSGTAIVTGRCRGDMPGMLRNADVDTVMIAADVHPDRAARYIASLTRAGYAAVDLRRQRVSYTLY